jgi:hypothetical protein
LLTFSDTFGRDYTSPTTNANPAMARGEHLPDVGYSPFVAWQALPNMVT